MKNDLKQAYKTIDSVMQEVALAEEQAFVEICLLFESENAKFNNKVIKELISILKEWNKAPVSETRARIAEIRDEQTPI